MTKKLLWIAIPIITVLVAAICILTYILLAAPSSNDIYLEHIKTAQHFMESGDADQAIFYYREALKSDDKQEEPYLKIAQIYYEQKNDMKSALDTLYEGYEKTGSEIIRETIERYLALSDGSHQLDTNDVYDPVLKKGVSSQALLGNFSSYTYKDYTELYTVVSEHFNTDSYVVEYSQVSAEFEYKNTSENQHILDSRTGKPVDEACPSEIRAKSLSAFISGAEQGVSVDDLKASGAYDVHVNNPGNGFATKYISFVCSGTVCYVECDDNGVISNPNGKFLVIPPKTSVEERKVMLYGSIVDADTNKLIKDAKVTIRRGKGAKSGAYVTEITASSGEFNVELDPGDYTVESVAEKYITDYYDVSLSENDDSVCKTFVMSPVLTGNQMRFVVEWTNTQYDLYIHINGRSSTNESIDYWEHGRSYGDVNGNIGGFETGNQNGQRYTSATITDSNGYYEFHVHGGEDQYNKDYLYKSNVVVKVYKDNDSSPTIFDLPPSIPLRYWRVCQVHDGVITAVD